MIAAPKVAISDDFLKSFSQVPKNIQGKVTEFLMKFRLNPDASGINYEKIKNAMDSQMRSVRIDQAYRAIVHKATKGNLFTLLWVDYHDRAYDWACRKTMKVHPETGSLQLIQVNETETVESKQEGEAKEGIFNQVRDRELIRLGIPEELLPQVRSIATESQLDELSDDFPAEAYEALIGLCAGFSIEEILREQELESVQEVDTEDFETAIEQADSQRRFALITDDLHLQELLSSPLEKWRVFLHPTQRKLVEKNANGPVRVLGGAGTGKTVVAMHRAKWLAQNEEEDQKGKILFTTFTRNLARDIEQNLASICDPDLMKKIKVVNLDSWVWEILKKYDYSYRAVTSTESKEAWENALTEKPDELELPDQFFKEEWKKVIQHWGIETLDEYLRVSRAGRGVPISRKQRKLVWLVLEEYRNQLEELNAKESEDAYRELRHLIESDKSNLGIRSVIVDEAQDIGMQAFLLLRSILPESKNDIFIVGDAHQRIYGNKVVLGKCGIRIVGRSRRLKINYRTTDQIRNWAVALLKGVNVDDLDGGADTTKGYRSLLQGPVPEILHFKTQEEELSAVLNRIKECSGDEYRSSTVCLAFRTNRLVEAWQNMLEENGLTVKKLDHSTLDNANDLGVRLCTMHRVKGLEFEHVILPNINEGVMPLERALVAGDEAEAEDALKGERCLMYVAGTRAKKTLWISSFGKKSRFICEA